MTGFRNILEHEGLRSPSYYHDKSLCISFQDCSPAEMGIIKAERLSWGYVDPNDLAKRLRQLKTSNNFSLRKFRPPLMTWNEPPVPETPRMPELPSAYWFDEKEYGILCLRKKLGEHQTNIYLNELQNCWDKVSDIELAPVPDICLLRHINHSPSGTLFPRFLVKALWELIDPAHKRALHRFYDLYKQADRRRDEAICRWKEEHPDEMLVDDAISMYHRTWPAQLMALLDSIDQEAIREGRRLDMADLGTTGRNMEELVTFWQNCGLVTGIRTPPSPQWPDPRSKLRDLIEPQHVWKRHREIEGESGGNFNDREKRRKIHFARWKESVLNMHCDPMTSELRISEPVLLRGGGWGEPESSKQQKREDVWKDWESSELLMTEPLLQKLEVVWKGWESSIDDKYVEDDMINVLSRWRRGEESSCSESSGTSELDDNTNIFCSGISRPDITALKDALPFLRGSPRTGRRSSGTGERLAANNVTWSGRLRSRLSSQGTSRQPRSVENSQLLVKPGKSKLSINRRQISRAKKPSVYKQPPVSSTDSGLHSSNAIPQAKPFAVRSWRAAKIGHSSRQGRTKENHNFMRGVQKIRKVDSKSSKSQMSKSDKHRQELRRLLTPPDSK